MVFTVRFETLATDYYDKVFDESKVEDEANTEVPLYDVIETESGEGKDVTEGYIHDQFGIKLTCVYKFQSATFSFSNVYNQACTRMFF